MFQNEHFFLENFFITSSLSLSLSLWNNLNHHHHHNRKLWKKSLYDNLNMRQNTMQWNKIMVRSSKDPSNFISSSRRHIIVFLPNFNFFFYCKNQVVGYTIHFSIQVCRVCFNCSAIEKKIPNKSSYPTIIIINIIDTMKQFFDHKRQNNNNRWIGPLKMEKNWSTLLINCCLFYYHQYV